VREGLFVGWSRSEIAGSEVKTGLPTEVFDCVVYKRDWLVEITLAGLKSMKPCHLDSHFLTVDNGWRRGEIKNVLLMGITGPVRPNAALVRGKAMRLRAEKGRVRIFVAFNGKAKASRYQVGRLYIEPQMGWRTSCKARQARH
jgi:hypothetical protein